MLNRAKGWQPAELAQIETDTMDAARIRNLLRNIDRSMETLPRETIDLHKLRDLKFFFETELKKRG